MKNNKLAEDGGETGKEGGKGCYFNLRKLGLTPQTMCCPEIVSVILDPNQKEGKNLHRHFACCATMSELLPAPGGP